MKRLSIVLALTGCGRVDVQDVPSMLWTAAQVAEVVLGCTESSKPVFEVYLPAHSVESAAGFYCSCVVGNVKQHVPFEQAKVGAEPLGSYFKVSGVREKCKSETLGSYGDGSK